jgi:hypothetical protein
VNSKGLLDPFPVSLAAVFFGTAMAIPDERMVALSIPTQTTLKGLREAAINSLCRSAMRDIFEIYFPGF